MNPAVIRLDCFGQSGPHQRIAEPNQKNQQDAYQRGLADGAETARATLNAMARQELQQLSAALREAESHRRLEFDELLSTVLRPMLEAVLDNVAPLGLKDRFMQLIASELSRAGAAVSGTSAIIRCAPQLVSDIKQLIETTEAPNIHIEADTSVGGRVDILVNQGTVTFDPDTFLSELRSLITTIS